jgi:uncharacterized protein (DUF2236 family)
VDVGFFGPGSVSWKVHEGPFLLLAGLRSLYLQALHPQAMAGVAQNSDYHDAAWARMTRTAGYVDAVVFGTTSEARQAAARVRGMHARLRATDPRTGQSFRVDEPHLLRWVHVTLVESVVTTVVRAGLVLTPTEVDGYYTEQVRAAELMGLDPSTVPATAGQVAAYYDEIRPELALSKESARAALFLAAPPLPYRLGLTPVRFAFVGLAGLAVGLLPPWARRLYGLPGLATTDLAAGVCARLLRRTLAVVPPQLVRRSIHGLG